MPGPEDDFDDAVNGDPDSLLGDDEANDEFDEMADFPDEYDSDDDEDEIIGSGVGISPGASGGYVLLGKPRCV